MRGDPPQYKKCGNRLHSTIATQGGHRYAAAEPLEAKIHIHVIPAKQRRAGSAPSLPKPGRRWPSPGPKWMK